MKYRLMQASDIEKVTTLYKDANLFATKKDIKAWTKDWLEKFPDLNYVYEVDEKIIAAVSAVVLEDKSVEFNDLVVEKKFRNRGIGTSITRFFMRYLEEKWYKKVHLWVHRKNGAAIPFHYRFGFKMTKLEKTKNISWVPDGEDIIVMKNWV